MSKKIELMKTNLTKAMLVVSIGSLSQLGHTEAFAFDRPGAALGTAIVPLGHVAWEQSLPSASYDDRRIDGKTQETITVAGDALLRIGVGGDYEIRVGWDGPMWQRTKYNGQDTETDGVGDVNIGIKRAINTHDERLQWAVLAQVNLANGDDEFTVDEEIYTLGSALNYQFSDDIATGITLYYDIQDGDLAWTVIPNIQYKISPRVSGFSEYVYRKQESQKKESTITSGVVWSVKDNLQLDASIGYSFNEQNPRANAGLGVSYLF